MRPPNFVFIVGEDTGRLLGCYGDDLARTPNLDRLAGQGMRFDQAFSTYPVCAPSRSTMVTGQHAMKIGTHQMRSRLLNPPRMFTRELIDAGYWINWWGKTDFNFEPTDGWRSDDQPWIERLAAGEMADRPWFVYTNIGVTHESGMWPPGPTGDGRPGRPKSPRVTDPAEVPVPPYLPDTPVVRADIARHYDNLAALDGQVGRILDALDASGQRDNTVVMFLADHGRGLPREKRWCYSAGLHLPLLVRWPAGLPAGVAEQRLVSWVDLAPTILSLAGVAIPPAYDGQVFLGDAAAAPRQEVFGGRDRMDEGYDLVRIIRTADWHYIRNFWPMIPYAQRNWYMERMPTVQELRRLHAAGELAGDAALFMQWPKPQEELYDVRRDPHCVHNLAADPALAEVRDSLRRRLKQWQNQIGDLGLVPERELIERGLVEDQLEQYRARLEPLPEQHRIGPAIGVVEWHEAAALGRPDRS